MGGAETRVVVVTDANILINLLHVGRLELLGGLPGYEFVVPREVVGEVMHPDQRTTLDSAIVQRLVRCQELDGTDVLDIFFELRATFGRGESACLALAQAKGWSIASDEKRAFRREVVKRIGPDRLLGTSTVFVRAIRAGLLTVEQADADKAALETKRFKMDLASFRDLVDVDE